MVFPTEIEYRSFDYSITDQSVSDIDDDLSGQWLSYFQGENDKREKYEQERRRKSRKRRSNRRNRQEQRLSVSNRVDATLNDSKRTNSDTPPSIPKKRCDFISSSDAYDNITSKNDDNDDGTREPPQSSLLDISERNNIKLGISTKTLDSPPFVPRRKGSFTGSLDKPLVATLSSAEFLKTLAMMDNESNKSKNNGFISITGPEEVCDVLDYILTMEVESM